MKPLHEQVIDALRRRQDWDDKQRAYYKMRRDGLRRAGPPYANAPDTHWPLIDGTIDKLKPFYWNQMFAGDRLADFVSLKRDLLPVQESAADYFDWVVKNRTNFSEQLMSACDMMCLRQRGILKVYWDSEKDRVVYEAVDPVHFVVPASASTDPSEADWMVHIKRLSQSAYLRNKRYTVKDEDTLKRLSGRARNEGDDAVERAQEEKWEREGLTFTEDTNTLLIWEVWEKTGDGWLIREYSPAAPEIMLRPPRKSHYRWQGKAWQPFVPFVFEITDGGWYSPRGVAEKLAPFEQAMNKQWNRKLEMMDFLTRPLFVTDGGGVPNTFNFQFKPGDVLPRGVQPANMPAVPPAFDQEMASVRMLAEQYLQLPAAGLAPDRTRGSGQADRVTATQVEYQAQLAATATNMRSWTFRLGLAEAYWRTWALLLQFKADEAAYYVGNDLKILPQQAFSDQFMVQPSGALDGWNRQRLKEQTYARFQLFRNDPRIDQDALYRETLLKDDARLVTKLLRPQGVGEQIEAEEEAKEIVILEKGFPAVVEPQENHLVRINILVGYLQKLAMTGAPVDPIAKQRLQEHLAVHVEYLKAMNPQAGRAVAEQLMGMSPENVTPMPGAGPADAAGEEAML